MNLKHTISLALAAVAALSASVKAGDIAKPNMLWILTDDQRADSIAAFNRMMTGKDQSALNYKTSCLAMAGLRWFGARTRTTRPW